MLYFFHLHECGNVVTDEEGATMPDLQSAIAWAVRCARGIIATEAESGKICLSCHIEIEDARTRARTVVPFTDAVKVVGI